jgi:hypothetical protein
MRSNRTVGLLTRMFLVVSLLFGGLALTGTTANAQHRFRGGGGVVVRPRVFVYPRTFYPRSFGWGYRGFYGPSYYSYYYPSNRVTEGQGYKDGVDDGKDDAKHNKGYDPYRHGDYKNGQTSGYIDGYLRGYADGFRQYNG